MSRDGREEPPRAPSDPRPDFLRGQLRQWMERVSATGKTPDLFELEMWLQSFERFFRVTNQPLSDKEQRSLTLRNWSEELRLVDNVLLRVVQLCASILTEEQVDLARFDRYIETYLKKDESLDPYVEKLLRQTTPEAGLSLLRESFEDLHLLLTDLVKLSRIPYGTFSAVGTILYREVRRSHLLALLIDKKFKPIHDRIKNPAVDGLELLVDEEGQQMAAPHLPVEDRPHRGEGPVGDPGELHQVGQQQVQVLEGLAEEAEARLGGGLAEQLLDVGVERLVLLEVGLDVAVEAGEVHLLLGQDRGAELDHSQEDVVDQA